MKQWLWDHRRYFLLLALSALIFFVIFALYGLPWRAVLYPALLCAVLLLLFLLHDGRKALEKHRVLASLRLLPDSLIEQLSDFDTAADRDYRQIIDALVERSARQEESSRQRLTDSMDYYTTWVHQVKTPIAAMRLLLEKEDSSHSRQLSEELFRIEQYVQMALTYTRLDADTTDYVFRKTDVDAVIRGVLRKFAGQFIGRGLRLHYIPCACTVVTDEKWLSFVLEQVLSNALKYTPAGSITIQVSTEPVLTVADTGIGIAGSDLPRIFEKGYTGYNGRTDKRASGLGLYLCRRICDGLGHPISVSSVLGKGTTVAIDLRQNAFPFE